MTVGKDVSSLFPDMINSMQTNNLEIKKLVYLYMINYAKSQPDLAVMGVNTFRRDANDPNPLIRALAIRTMGCVRVDKVTEYICEPLRRCLKDDDPYVRKTAALCVAKLNDLDSELSEDQGFVESLRELVSDANPAVVANAVAALTEIASTSDKPDEVFEVTTTVLQKLLAAIGECSEWGQVFILDALGAYVPRDGSEAESIIERVTPRLQHSNAAVVMGAVKVVVRLLDLVVETDTRRALAKKLAPPLVTLVSSNAPEIVYVALRNIQLIIAAKPEILSKDVKVFFCTYKDPLYVKMEKLEVLIQLVRDQTAEQVLGELKEYASEVDVEFVRRSVRAIGRTAIKLERTAERCVNVLIELIQTKVNYVVQEAIVTIKDIFRKYPNRYESVIQVLCESLETLDDPSAKAAMIWIIGENADRIDNAPELLESFVDSFFDEISDVQLQLLTATVKLFLVRADSKPIMERVLKLSTEETDNPDLRDRAFIYWRLLTIDPNAARQVVQGEKPVIEDDSSKLDETLLSELLENVSTLASVYHKPARSFTKKIVRTGESMVREGYEDGDEDGRMEGDESPTRGNDGANKSEDLLDLGAAMFGSSEGPSSSGGMKQLPLPVVLEANDPKSGGVQIAARLDRRDGSIVLDIELTNLGLDEDAGDRFAIKFNKNTFALTPVKTTFVMEDGVVEPGQTRRAMVPIKIDPNNANKGSEPTLSIEMAMKYQKTTHVAYFQASLPFYALFLENPPNVQWDAPNQHALEGYAQQWPTGDLAGLLMPHNLSSLGGDFFVFTTSTGSNCICKLGPKPKIEIRCTQKQVLPFAVQGVIDLLARLAASQAPPQGGGAMTGPATTSTDDILNLFG